MEQIKDVILVLEGYYTKTNASNLALMVCIKAALFAITTNVKLKLKDGYLFKMKMIKLNKTVSNAIKSVTVVKIKLIIAKNVQKAFTA